MQQAGITIGKAITTVSAVAVLILFCMGKPNYKWAGMLVVGGALLVSFSTVADWLIGPSSNYGAAGSFGF